MYRISEIFYSIQGEGARSGTANIFIRFAGCNLSCDFCDTDHKVKSEYTAEQLSSEIQRYDCKNIILTGGEPLLQYDYILARFLKMKGYYIAVETNGTQRIPFGIDWVTVSPKKEVVFKKADEVKLVIKEGDILCRPPEADYYYLSPCWDENLEANLKYCIEMVKQYPFWRLTYQKQKVWKIK